MTWRYDSYAFSLFAATIVSVATAGYIWRWRRSPGATMLALVMVGAAAWSFGYGLEISGAGLSTKVFWAKFQYLGICTVPLAMFTFSARYVGWASRLRPLVWLGLAVLPVVTFGLVVTNEAHHLIWSSVGLAPPGYFPALQLEHGPFFWVYWIYSQILIIFTFFLICSSLLRSKSLYRKQMALLLFGFLAPWLGNILYVLRIIPNSDFDFTPIGFALTGIALALVCLRFKFLDIVPVARNTIIDNMGDGMIVLDTKDRILDANLFARPLLRSSISDAIGQPASRMMEGWDGVYGGEPAEEPGVEVELERGEQHYLLKSWPLRDRGGRHRGRLILARDITRSKRIESKLKESEERYRSLVALSPDAVVVHSEGVVVYINAAGARILGASGPEEIIGTPVLDLVHPDYREQARERIRQRYRGIEPSGVVLEKLLRLDGRAIDVETAATLVPYEGKQGVQLVIRDVTRRKALEAELERRAFHDSLTGLPNRTLFMERLERALARTGRRHETVAVLFLDLNGFKLVNDSLGHQCGDELLAAAGRCLTSCVRPMDTVARLGGDEFTILLESISGLDEALQVAERILQKLQEPFVIAGHEILLTTSIGISLSSSVADRPGDLLREADVAMYRAKKWSRARYEVFEPDMSRQSMERLDLYRDINLAVERGELKVRYQPVVRVATGEITGMEALLRWEHPERGLLRPSHFITAAEETGLILPIGRWMLEEACRQGSEWRKAHPDRPPLLVQVNVSARQLRHLGFAMDLSRVLEKTGTDPSHLGLDITESVLIEEDAGSAAATLETLRELGVKLALDDFGTGYSSLSYLKRFSIDIIKIDRPFIEGIDRNPEDAILVSSMTNLARSLGKQVVAEGVERAAQVEKLREWGCDQGQGNHFWSPLTGEEASSLLGRQDLCRLKDT